MIAAKHQQHAEVEAVGVEEAVHAQHAGGDRQHQHDGQVGDKEQHDTFHCYLPEMWFSRNRSTAKSDCAACATKMRRF
jgi:hypothetical protein